jgi:hypothetical protein
MSDLRDDPAFALTSYNWILFGMWEFDPRRRAGYLGGVNLFIRELAIDEEGCKSKVYTPSFVCLMTTLE